MTDEAGRVRPPRFLHKDGIVRPYKHVEAEGNDILQVNRTVLLLCNLACDKSDQ